LICDILHDRKKRKGWAERVQVTRINTGDKGWTLEPKLKGHNIYT
jgi:hypothetical protein